MINLLLRWLYMAIVMCISMSGFAFFILIAKFVVESIRHGEVIFPFTYVVITSLKLGFYIGVVITVGLWVKWKYNIK